MTVLSLNPGQPSSSAELVDTPPSRWKRPIFAVLWSLLAPGLEQFYNSEYSATSLVISGLQEVVPCASNLRRR